MTLFLSVFLSIGDVVAIIVALFPVRSMAYVVTGVRDARSVAMRAVMSHERFRLTVGL